MKKQIAVFLTTALLAAALSGCSGVPVAVEEVPQDTSGREEMAANENSVKTGLFVGSGLTAEPASEEADGSATTDISMIAVTVNESGVIESCKIDAIQGKVTFDEKGQLTMESTEILSKNELGEAYGMKQYSPIGKEWNEQAAAIAQYAEGKTVEELKNGAVDETGAVKDADLASSATIYLGGFISGIETAVNNASYIGAEAGDELILTSISTGSASASAGEEGDGNAQLDSNIAALTVRGNVITSCVIDSVQSKAAFGTDGAFVGEPDAEVLSKNQLGEAYGLKEYSPIGKEWNEQIAAFCDYVTGKTFEEVSGIALTETTAPADADLAASVSIAIGDFMNLMEKASAMKSSVGEDMAVSETSLKTGLSVIASLTGENASAKADGSATTDISLIAVTVDGNGVIESCKIDSIQGKISFDAKGQLTSGTEKLLSKNELGDDYGMKQASPIGKEWNEQAAAIAAYAEGKTVEELKTGAVDEYGVVKDADLASSATIYLGGFISGIEDAVNNASYIGAEAGDELILTSISTGGASASAGEEGDGNAQLDSNIAALTVRNHVITSCVIDSVQSKAAFGTDGAFTGEPDAEVPSKNQLGEAYGLKEYSPIGKEWNEQTAAFCEYVTGKTFEEVSGIALTETTAPAEADLAASVSIAIGDFMSLLEKAANVER